jgi:uncharacterized protein
MVLKLGRLHFHGTNMATFHGHVNDRLDLGPGLRVDFGRQGAGNRWRRRTRCRPGKLLQFVIGSYTLHDMIQRQLGLSVRAYASQYPVVAVIGPRQSGKTTLVRALFPELPYVNLEALDQRQFAREDPRGFLGEIGGGGILDEAQHVPDLFSYIQTVVDETSAPGQFILTGSQNFGMMERVTQSLAGRVAIATLLPLGMGELSRVSGLAASLDEVLFRGFYPRIHAQSLHPEEALRFYVQAYVERDVRQLTQVGDLDRFATFLRLAAGRVGQLLNASALGGEVGVSHNTIRKWLSVLEASYLVKRLQPWHANLGKRLVKTPKLYFVDVGLACHLLGITRVEHLRGHPQRGALFENLIVAEALKQRLHAGKPDNLLFFRDQTGHEVDLLLEDGSALHAIEIKSAQTISNSFFNNLDYFGALSGKVASATVVYGGESNQSRSRALIQGWRQFHIPQ